MVDDCGGLLASSQLGRPIGYIPSSTPHVVSKLVWSQEERKDVIDMIDNFLHNHCHQPSEKCLLERKRTK